MTAVYHLLNTFCWVSRHIWWAEHIRTTAFIHCSITCSTTGSWILDVAARVCGGSMVLIAAVLLVAAILLLQTVGREDAR